MGNIEMNSLIQGLLSYGYQENVLSSVDKVQLVSGLILNASCKLLVACLLRQLFTVRYTFSFNLGMVQEGLVALCKFHSLLKILRSLLCNMLRLKTQLLF